MTDKTFNVGGVSKTKGQYKVRFAGDMTRVKILQKTDTDINLVELPKAMTKGDLVAFLKSSDLYKNAEYAAAIDAADAKYNAAPVVMVKSGKPNMADIKARASKKDPVDA